MNTHTHTRVKAVGWLILSQYFYLSIIHYPSQAFRLSQVPTGKRRETPLIRLLLLVRQMLRGYVFAQTILNE